MIPGWPLHIPPMAAAAIAQSTQVETPAPLELLDNAGVPISSQLSDNWTEHYILTYEGENYPFKVTAVSEGERYFPDADMVAPVLEITGVVSFEGARGSCLLRHKDNPYHPFPFTIQHEEYAKTKVKLIGCGTVESLEWLGRKDTGTKHSY